MIPQQLDEDDVWIRKIFLKDKLNELIQKFEKGTGLTISSIEIPRLNGNPNVQVYLKR